MAYKTVFCEICGDEWAGKVAGSWTDGLCPDCAAEQDHYREIENEFSEGR